jgi:hypothetical protein
MLRDNIAGGEQPLRKKRKLLNIKTMKSFLTRRERRGILTIDPNFHGTKGKVGQESAEGTKENFYMNLEIGKSGMEAYSRV